MTKHHHPYQAEGWLPIESAPLDGTPVEINANNGPTLCAYADLRDSAGPQWWVLEKLGRAGAIAYPTQWRPVRLEVRPVEIHASAPVEVLRRALKAVLPHATADEINRVADAVLGVAFPLARAA